MTQPERKQEDQAKTQDNVHANQMIQRWLVKA
jgi:hypothetical protein